MNFLKSLIGGQIVKGYSISGDPLTGLGHHKHWKLYKAKKDSTGGDVSVFLIQKKSLKSSTKQEIIKSAKKQATGLAKIRHPGILALIEPYTEDQNFISFVTERVQGNLSSLVRQKKLQQFLSSELELKLNLFPLLQTITFLQQIVKLCHLGISLQSIYVTPEGKWKIGGMNYSQVLTGEENQMIDGVEFFDYLHLPPEVVKQSRFNKLSDSYSLGILFINFMMLLKKTPNTLMQPTDSRQLYEKNSKSYKDYCQFPAIIQSTTPQQLIQLLSQLLIENPPYRLNITSLESSKWINDSIVLTVKYLQKIANYENKQQVEFLKGLSGVIDKFSGKILHKRIIPVLCNLLKFSHLVASVIFILLDIMKRNMITVEDWRKNVWPEMKSITQGKEMTAQSLYLLISNMEVLQKYINEENFMSAIIPLYLKCFDCPAKLKLLALKHVERLTKKYDYQFTKTKIIPKLVNTMKDDKIQVRKDALKALYAIINRLDPHTIVNVVLSGLQNCRKAGADNFINSITVEIYNKITLNISAEVLATKIMPGLMPYLVDPSIQKQQFGMYKNALLKMMNKIQDERKKTWSQQQNTALSHERFTEKDYALDKLDNQNVANSGQVIGNQAKFDFLNQYKGLGSASGTQSQQQQQVQQQRSSLTQPVSNTNNKTTNQFMFSNSISTNQSGNNLSFGFLVPKQTNIQQPKKAESHEQITITDYSFGNFDKFSNFDMGFETNTTLKKKNTSGWDMNSFITNNTEQQAQFKINNNESKKIQQYNTDDFNFAVNPVQNTFSLNKQTKNKQLPFSPSSQPQNITFDKPTLKGPAENKKLVGPPGQGGIKKPPKYNEFNIPQQQPTLGNNKNQIQPFNTSFDTAFLSNSSQNTSNHFVNNNKTIFSQQPSSSINDSTLINNFKLEINDPFAEVEQQYNIKSITNNNFSTSNLNANNNLNFNTFNTQKNNSKSNDPFDDLL